MVRHLTVRLPRISILREEVNAVVAGQSYGSAPIIEELSDVGLELFDAILSVGSSGRSNLPWTVVNSNGWAVRVSSEGRSLPSECSQPNAVGALGAACIGTAEVFKRLIRLKPDRGQLHDVLAFSFHSYLAEDNPGLALPKDLQLDLLLVGAGAIGNGTIHLLRSLSLTGRIAIVDKQVYESANWGTCILVGPQDFGVPKALVGERRLRGKVDAKGFRESIQEFQERCGRDIAHPKLIINGLDNIPARRAVQDFWPDQIVDGAIGPTSCEVTLHPWGPDLSCLKCDFEEAPIAAELTQSQATGLKLERLSDPSAVVSQEDIEAAPPEKREWLRERKGKPVCSVVSEGVLRFLAGESQAIRFQPSVPFVACLSSCMIVSELIRYVQQWPQILETGYQFDVMTGPEHGQRKSHARKSDCICVTRRTNIEALRQRRSQ
jgi:molybdopterin/thiamine biosynthesis adenylyltransferase